MEIKIALITGIIGSEMREDVWGTLEAVAGMGYQGLEFGPELVERTGGSPTALKRRLDDLGLQTFSYGTSLEVLNGDLEAFAAQAVALGCRYVVLFWAPCESRAGVLERAARFDEIGAALKGYGLQFCYHNHAHEFKTFDGETGLDLLFGNTDPDLVKAEIDVAWVRYGGADPVAHIERFAGRCPLIHVKDIYTTEQEHAWTEVGTGIVDVKGVVEAGARCGAQWFTVEQDRPRDLPPMESIKVSYENLKHAADSL